MKFLIGEDKIRGLIESGKITPEDLGLKMYKVYIPYMPNVKYAHDGIDDPYRFLPTNERSCEVEMIGYDDAHVKKCNNGRTIVTIHSFSASRCGFASRMDAIDLCIEREKKYYRGERRILNAWLKSRAPFNH